MKNNFNKLEEIDVTQAEFNYKQKSFYKIDDSEISNAGGFAVIEGMNWSKVANQIENIRGLNSQYCICSLFAIELFLKSILFNTGVNVTKQTYSHDIHSMFEALNKNIQDEIKKDIKIDSKINKALCSEEYIKFDTFEQELKYISQDFCYLRYEYEKFLTGKGLFILSNFITQLRNKLESVALRINLEDKHKK